jgi:hypothetical protein
MTRRDWTFLGRSLVPLLLAALALALPSGAAAVEPGTGTITGTVTFEGGVAAVGVAVCASPVVEIEEEEESPCKLAKAGGNYEISGLRAGEYKVSFWPEEGSAYTYQYYDDASSWGTAEPIAVTAGGVVPDIDAELEEGATISGTVTSAATGVPAGKVEVCAESGEGFGCAETGSSGLYTIRGLTAGKYVVYFLPEGNGLGLLAQVYQGRSFSEEPDFVAVARKAHVTGINAALALGGAIEGTVRSAANGSPLAGVEICLSEAARLGFPTCLPTGASGAYRFYGIPTGSWKVAFSPSLTDVYGSGFAGFVEEEDSPAELAPWNDSYPTQWWNGQATFAAATPIAVTAPATVTEIDGSLGTPPALVQPGPTPPAEITPPAVSKVAKAKPKKHEAKGPLRCKRGFTKHKLRGRVRCVRSHKVVRHAKKKHRKHGA